MANQHDVKIKKPCPKNWDEMTGDEKSRFCSHCQKSVHNLEELSSGEAENLLCQSSKSICIRMKGSEGRFKLKDGWYRRAIVAGAAGLTLIPIAGCTQDLYTTGDTVAPDQSTPIDDGATTGVLTVLEEQYPEPVLGEAVAQPMIGKTEIQQDDTD